MSNQFENASDDEAEDYMATTSEANAAMSATLANGTLKPMEAVADSNKHEQRLPNREHSHVFGASSVAGDTSIYSNDTKNSAGSSNKRASIEMDCSNISPDGHQNRNGRFDRGDSAKKQARYLQSDMDMDKKYAPAPDPPGQEMRPVASSLSDSSRVERGSVRKRFRVKIGESFEDELVQRAAHASLKEHYQHQQQQASSHYERESNGEVAISVPHPMDADESPMERAEMEMLNAQVTRDHVLYRLHQDQIIPPPSQVGTMNDEKRTAATNNRHSPTDGDDEEEGLIKESSWNGSSNKSTKGCVSGASKTLLNKRVKRVNMQLRPDDDDSGGFEGDIEEVNLDDIDRFFTTPSYTKTELEAVSSVIEKNFAKPLHALETGVKTAVKLLAKEKLEKQLKQQAKKKTILKRDLEDYLVRGDPREYQRRLFDIAKKQNSIIHLGTGLGKTLIALLLIKEFSYQWESPDDKHNKPQKQTLFLVPSVALAVQQSATLRANLPPVSIQTACYDSVRSDMARRSMTKANIIVATHGAIVDLLSHYSDMFHMDRFNLVVMDECHYAIGKHMYATLMQKFYHPLQNRPRVLGLTASPLINVKQNDTDEKLESMLANLEETLDSRLVSVGSIMPRATVGTTGSTSMDLLRKSADESIIPYLETEHFPALPRTDNLPLHESRQREFNQLVHIYQELGPYACGNYCEVLTRELSQNSFDKETSRQFKCAINHLHRIAQLCSKICVHSRTQGRSDKLLALEEMVQNEIEKHGAADTVGLVFVERRITALALHHFFLCRDKAIQNKSWVDLRHVRNPSLSRPKMEPVQFKREHGVNTSTTHINSIRDHVGSQFDDAEVDVSMVGLETLKMYDDKAGKVSDTPSQQFATESQNEKENNQFMDADEDDSFSFLDRKIDEETTDMQQVDAAQVENEQPEIMAGDVYLRRNAIASAALVRNAAQIFNSLSCARKSPEERMKLNGGLWLHKETKIRDVLSKLRRKETNLLIATSVVEEGVDVQACSFVTVFDTLKNTKGYIQMKGRARQKKAKFCVLEDRSQDVSKKLLSLGSAQEMEVRAYDFIENRKFHNFGGYDIAEESIYQDDTPSDPCEELALRKKVFRVTYGVVDLQAAKGLLNRYALSVPMDLSARSSRDGILAHLPLYKGTMLILPSHLPTSARRVILPREFHGETIKERHQMMSLMACVRLHNLGLFNDRLLPLTRQDMKARIFKVAEQKLPDVIWPERTPVPDESSTETTVFVYTINQTSDKLSSASSTFGGTGHRLALVTFQLLRSDVPDVTFQHTELDAVSISMGPAVEVRCNVEQRQMLSDVFILLMNQRWRRKSLNMYFATRSKGKDDRRDIVDPYLISLISEDGSLDWEFMKILLQESKRSLEERTEAARGAMQLDKPRLWTPLYDANVQYIVYGTSDETCSAIFPHEKEGVSTYRDYFLECRGFAVPENSPLFDSQRLWTLPSNFPVITKDRTDVEMDTAAIKSESDKYTVVGELSSVKLPQHGCAESVFPNVFVALLTCLLPQYLFYFERRQVTKTFKEHCSRNFPKLRDCIGKLEEEEVSMALTAKRCGLDTSYEKLEWLGDAVLKVVQTDSLLQSVDLKLWIQFLHEGDLSMLRSAMGCNDQLEKICSHLGLNKFILSRPLARGQWLPSTLEIDSKEPSEDDTREIAGKINADVVESLLGLIYLHFGYEDALAVADELQVTLQRDTTADELSDGYNISIPGLVDAAREATGYSKFRKWALLEEAFTHPTSLHSDVPSYQRLEWAGDAALCLAAREWIFRNQQDLELGDMVSLEAALVSNETLAFLSVRKGLHHFLNHRDNALPARIESYRWSLNDAGRGLWGAAPPKSISDIVEALFGAVHVDGGFAAGQRACLRMLDPVLTFLQKSYEKSKSVCVKHPKKALQETVGELVQLYHRRESEFALIHGDVRVWFGKSWGKADSAGNEFVSSIEYLGTPIVAIADSSAIVARNRVCSLVVKVIEMNPKLAKRIQACRIKVESTISRSQHPTSDDKVITIEKDDDDNNVSGTAAADVDIDDSDP